MRTTKYKILKYATYALVAIFLCVLQNTPGLFAISGVKPMLVMSFAVCVTLFEKETAGGLFGAFAGMLCDLFGSYTFGFYTLLLFVGCVLVGLLTQSFMRPVLFNAVLFTLALGCFIQLVGFAFTMLLRSVPDAWQYYGRCLLPMCAYTAVTAAVFFYPASILYHYFEAKVLAA
ncbi:MAG: rod shape-determining protein MreD [Angelakisella sp.]